MSQLQDYKGDGLLGMGFNTLSKGFYTLMDNLYN
jgi:hypothetical protein